MERAIERCDSCGCIVHLRAWTRKESLATREQRREAFEAARAADDYESISSRLAVFGHEQVWGLEWKCPGCGSRGGHGAAYALEEAEEIVARQNRVTTTPEALQAAADWKSEVRRRAEAAAVQFEELLLGSFPEWRPFVVRVAAADPRVTDEPGSLEWNCALMATVPSENAAVFEPLEVCVLGNEIRPSWVGHWHHHLEPVRGVYPRGFDHLPKALSLIEDLVSERTVVVTVYRAESVTCGGEIRAGDPLPTHWLTHERADGGDRMVLRSWRGTHDRVIE